LIEEKLLIFGPISGMRVAYMLSASASGME
jgi:hypothetical protein